MKKRFFTIVAMAAWLAAVPLMAQSPYFRAITNLNPVGYWPMHETEPAAPGDIETNYGWLGQLGNGYYPDWATANGHIIQRQATGALTGDTDPAIHFTQTRISGSTISFTNGLYIPHTSPLTTLYPPFSVECWYYPSNVSTGVDIWAQNGDEGLNAGTVGGVTGYICGIRMVWVNATFVVYGFDNQFSIPTENSNKLAAENVAVATNQWYHLVVTCDAHTNVILYTNGNVAASGAAAGKYSPDYWTPLSIGSGLGDTRSIAGSLDEFAVYTNALPQSEIQQHYNSALDPTDYGAYYTNVQANYPVIYLRMDSPSYTAPPESTWPALVNYGSTNGVALGNGVYSPGTGPGLVSGPFNAEGGAFAGLPGEPVAQLSGVSSYADAGYAPAYNPTGATPFTITAMFRGNPCDNRLQAILGHSTNSWALNIGTTGKLQCQLGTNTASAITSVGVYNDGNWHQAVEVYSPASNPSLPGTNALYVDGSLDTSVSTVTTNGIQPGTNLDVMLGSDPQYTNNPVGVGRQFSGQVCEVALFSNALTAAQVSALYLASGVPPIITQQPVSGSVNLNGAFTNTIIATGSISSYQWYENGIPLSGQINPSLILNPVQASANSTNYYVVVSNAYTTVTSAVVSLTVNSAATVVAQTPTNLLIFAGSEPTLFVSTVGSGQIQYQWTSNGNAISGATASSYTVANPASSVTYGCQVHNAFGTNSIAPIILTVLSDPTVPYPLSVLASHPVDYWRLDEASGNVGYDYFGGNNGVYTNTQLGSAGYTSQFSPQTDPNETSAAFGALSTNNSYLGQIPQIVNFGAPNGANAEFSVEAWVQPYSTIPAAGLVALGSGNGGEQFCLQTLSVLDDLSFFVRDANGVAHTAQSTFSLADAQWHHVVGVCDEANGILSLYVDGELVASSTLPVGGGLLASTNTLAIGSRQEGPGTQFDDQTSGSIDDVALYNYALNSTQVQTHYVAAGISPRDLQVQPSSQNADVGATVTFSANVIATPPLSYFWTDQNTATIISTNAVLTIPDVQSSDSYSLQVTNLYGQSSQVGSVNVYSGPVSLITDLSPLFQEVTPGTPLSFTVGMYGTPPITYQWFLNGTNVIPGATNATYDFLAQVGSNTYTVMATNEGGAAYASSSAALVVGMAGIGFGDGTGWTLNGGATFTGSPIALELTDGNLNEARSAFYNTPQNVDGFLAQFTYTPGIGTTTLRADGAVFTLQNSPSKATAKGLDGGGLGFEGISPSVAFEFDLFVNAPGGTGINCESNGVTGPSGGFPNGPTGTLSINSLDPINTTLFYNYAAGELYVGLTDTNAGTSFDTNYYVGNISDILGTNAAYVGFTGGTGGDDSVQLISNFSYSTVTFPTLSVNRGAGGAVVIAWPETVSPSFVLQQSSEVNGPWSDVTVAPTPNLATAEYQVTTTPLGNAQFYRLSLPNP